MAVPGEAEATSAIITPTPTPAIPATAHLALGFTEVYTEMSLPRNPQSILRTELFSVPLSRAISTKGRSIQTAGRDHTVKREAEPSTTTTWTQVWEDVTAEGQAVQPERREPPCRAGGREKQGKPNTTERLSSYAQRVVITSKIQAILFTCNSNTTLLQKIWGRLLLVESTNARI